MNPNFMQTPIVYLKGVGPHRADVLQSELGINSYQDLINFFPNSLRCFCWCFFHAVQIDQQSNANNRKASIHQPGAGGQAETASGK